MPGPQDLNMMLQALQALARQTAMAIPGDKASDLSQRANALEKIFEQIGLVQNQIAQMNAVPPEVKLMQPGPLEQLAQLQAQPQAQALGMAPPQQQGGLQQLAAMFGMR